MYVELLCKTTCFLTVAYDTKADLFSTKRIIKEPDIKFQSQNAGVDFVSFQPDSEHIKLGKPSYPLFSTGSGLAAVLGMNLDMRQL